MLPSITTLQNVRNKLMPYFFYKYTTIFYITKCYGNKKAVCCRLSLKSEQNKEFTKHKKMIIFYIKLQNSVKTRQ